MQLFHNYSLAANWWGVIAQYKIEYNIDGENIEIEIKKDYRLNRSSNN